MRKEVGSEDRGGTPTGDWPTVRLSSAHAAAAPLAAVRWAAVLLLVLAAAVLPASLAAQADAREPDTLPELGTYDLPPPGTDGKTAGARRPSEPPRSETRRSEPRGSEPRPLRPDEWLAGAEMPRDLRSIVYLDLDCRSDLARRAVSLFANGTVRLREGPRGEETVKLAELSPEDLSGYLTRLQAEDLSETDHRTFGAGGEWVESCRLVLELPERPLATFRFESNGSFSLALSRILGVTSELEGLAREVAHRESRLPSGYQPRPGDLLERWDGARFRVAGLTADKRGVELQGVEQPLVLYVSIDDLAGEFLTLVESAGF